MLENYLKIEPEIKEALDKNRPVVALESTIISHGMPHPQNVETAKALEQTVRDNGAIPATIAVIEGKIKIGLSCEELDFLATDKHIAKASRRDLPCLLANKKSAATTVAATMICASLANIGFFATGGIGGVHRNAAKTMDISADLQEFARTSVLVVSAGAKAILDIGLTLEYLETMGIPVLGYKTDIMPAFYYPNSGFKAPQKINSAKEAAEIFKASRLMGYKSGILVGNPTPQKDAMNKEKIEDCIEKALIEADKLKITGQGVTPFLLGKLCEITNRASLKTNIALVKSNAAVCAQIAAEYYKL